MDRRYRRSGTWKLEGRAEGRFGREDDVKVLIDTNIILDIALNRKPFVEQAALLWRLA